MYCVLYINNNFIRGYVFFFLVSKSKLKVVLELDNFWFDI